MKRTTLLSAVNPCFPKCLTATVLVFTVLASVLFCWTTVVSGATAIKTGAIVGKIVTIDGQAIIQSGTELTPAKPGTVIKDGDFLLTKQGISQVVFNDGAELKIKPLPVVKTRIMVVYGAFSSRLFCLSV